MKMVRTHKHTHVPAVYFFFNFRKDGSFPACVSCTKAVATAYQSLVTDIPGHGCVYDGVRSCVCVFVCVCVCVCVCAHMFAPLQMSLFIDGWRKQKQIHQSVKSHIIFHHLAINHRCECVRACIYMCMCVI